MHELFVPAVLRSEYSEEIPRRPFTGGPRPEALIITCSEATLDQPLSGYFEDLPVFLLRTFGNRITGFLHAQDELIEALEEAVCWWRVPRIVVCGHSGCRALPEPSEKTNHSRAQSLIPETAPQSLPERVEQANRILTKAKSHTLEQLAALRTYPFIENSLQEQDLQFSALFYLHGSGLFLRYDESQDEFFPLM